MGRNAPTEADRWKTDFSRHTVPLEEIVRGGPTKDGIPPIDHPRFVSVQGADPWIEDSEPVLVVRHGGTVRAYPYQILIWHEIVNDEVEGLPLAVTYCPLCNTGLVFQREHEGRILDFGTTGRLRLSDLVMYDRQTESWWQQATGEGIVGRFAGDELHPHPAQTVSWACFRSDHPGGEVLSRETGHVRPYGRSSFEGYDGRTRPRESVFGRDFDDRLPAMERVVALERKGVAVAYPFQRLRRAGAVNDEIAGDPVVVLWSPGTSSPVDRNTVAGGRDVGAAAVFSRIVGGWPLTFEAEAEGRYRDRETGSTWTLLGNAVGGPLEGVALDPVSHGIPFWFAWAAFRPDTEIRTRCPGIDGMRSSGGAWGFC